MNWLIPASLMYVASVIAFLLLKKCQKQGLSNNLINFSSFFVPTLLFLLMIILNRDSFFISPLHLIVILTSALLSGYLGNVLALESITAAPNMGYSIIIFRSYVVVTFIFSTLFLNVRFDSKQLLAILMIVIFSGLILISKTVKAKEAQKNFRWAFFAVIACILFGGYTLVSKYLLNENIKISVYSFYYFSFVTIIFFLQETIKKKHFVLNKTDIFLLMILGAVGMFSNFCMLLAFTLAPNVSYVNAVTTSSTAIIALLSSYFFNEELNLRKIIGIVGVSVGIIILVI